MKTPEIVLVAFLRETPTLKHMATTCFGSSLSSSGRFLDPSELLEIQVEWVVYHMMCGYVACVPDCRGSIYLGSTTDGSTTLQVTQKELLI
jgi:hypothetical protein